MGAVVLPAIILITLSTRRGGLRNALRNIVRRLKLFLILAGVYLLGSGVIKVALDGRELGDYAVTGLAAVLALVFILQAPDRQLPG